MYSNLTLKDFLTELSSSDPTPGGGAASSITSAMGFALLKMVLSVSYKKNPNKKVNELINSVDEYINFSLENATLDAEAFDRVMAAYKLPKKTEEEKKLRINSIEEALKQATIVPLSLIEKLFEAKNLIIDTSIVCIDSIASDFFTAINLIDAAMSGEYSVVLINLKLIKDRDFVRSTFTKLDSIKKEFDALINDLKNKFDVKLKPSEE